MAVAVAQKVLSRPHPKVMATFLVHLTIIQQCNRHIMALNQWTTQTHHLAAITIIMISNRHLAIRNIIRVAAVAVAAAAVVATSHQITQLTARASKQMAI